MFQSGWWMLGVRGRRGGSGSTALRTSPPSFSWWHSANTIRSWLSATMRWEFNDTANDDFSLHPPGVLHVFDPFKHLRTAWRRARPCSRPSSPTPGSSAHLSYFSSTRPTSSRRRSCTLTYPPTSLNSQVRLSECSSWFQLLFHHKICNYLADLIKSFIIQSLHGTHFYGSVEID